MRLGESEVSLHSDFKLFMTTKLASPHYLPEILNKVNLINFTVSLIGFEEQLLQEVVMHERSELESRRKEYIHNLVQGQRQISELEDKILIEIEN